MSNDHATRIATNYRGSWELGRITTTDTVGKGWVRFDDDTTLRMHVKDLHQFPTTQQARAFVNYQRYHGER